MEVKNICGKCGEVNIIDNILLFHNYVVDEEGHKYKVMYYKCKRCNELIVVQIDDKRTLDILAKLKRLIVKTMKKRMSHDTINPTESIKKDRLMKELREKRQVLNELMNGKKLYKIDGEIFIERLTFPKESDIIVSDM